MSLMENISLLKGTPEEINTFYLKEEEKYVLNCMV